MLEPHNSHIHGYAINHIVLQSQWDTLFCDVASMIIKSLVFHGHTMQMNKSNYSLTSGTHNLFNDNYQWLKINHALTFFTCLKAFASSSNQFGCINWPRLSKLIYMTLRWTTN